MSETLPLATVKAKLSEVVDRVASTHERVVVTRRGRPVAVLRSPDDLASIEETLDILADPKTMAAIAEGEADLAAGRVISGQELAERYRRRR